MITNLPSLINQVVCISVVKSSVKVISYKPRLIEEAWLVLPSKDTSKAIIIKKIQEKVWQAKALAFAKTQQATK